MACSVDAGFGSIEALIGAELLEIPQDFFFLSCEVADMTLKACLLGRGRGERRS